MTIKIEIPSHITDMKLAFRGIYDNIIEERDKRFLVFENVSPHEFDMLKWYWTKEIRKLG
jgi:hypothetical protein